MNKQEQCTKFWAEHNANFWLSNFYGAELKFDGIVYPTSEHLYQASKCKSQRKHKLVAQASTPKEAKDLAKLYGSDLTIENKAYLMRIAICVKFDQHEELKTKLMATKGVIIEASPFDFVWGAGPRGCGLNLMGLLLMELRDKYITLLESEEPSTIPPTEADPDYETGVWFRSAKTCELFKSHNKAHDIDIIYVDGKAFEPAKF